MRFMTDWINFELPDELEDCTDYIFEVKNPIERFTLNFGRIENGEGSAEQRISEIRDRLKHNFEDDLKIEKDEAITIDEAPGFYLQASFRVDDELCRIRVASLQIEIERTMGMVYLTDVKADHSDRFDQIQRSVHITFDEQSGALSKGCTRYTIRNISLDLPTYLYPPNTYRFSNVAEDIEIFMTAYPLAVPELKPPDFEEEVESDTGYGGQIIERQDDRLEFESAECRIARYLVVEEDLPEPEQRAVCRARITLPAVAKLSLESQAEPDMQDQLNAAFDRLVNAILNREKAQ